jgi:cellulose synthase/poly-beta-1,6-N-acetylglucosamine synthase-like glycosyltransferase
MSHPFSKGFFGNLTYAAVTVGVSLIAPLLIVAGTIALTLVIPGLVIDATLMTIYFVITCTLYNAFLLIVLARAHTKQGEDVAHYFSILVPARNEEGVIAQTLECILNLDYPSELFEVVVINDGSKDKTGRVVQELQRKYPNLKLMNISGNNGGRGKSLTLNAGFADFLLTWRGLGIKPRYHWIIGVFDSDAAPQKDMLKKVSFQFNDPAVGGVQTLVRIKNSKTSFLAKLQDIEFLAFARIMQSARNSYAGSVALGGNGQFARATALDTAALKQLEEYWRTDSLTEDLDLGVRLLANKWKNVYIGDTAVFQEGTETLVTMFRQRERWAWGTLQTMKRFVLRLSFWRTHISLKTKIDVSLYLTHIILPVLVFICWAWSGLSLLGVIRISNFFPIAFTIANGFSFFPLLGYGLWKEKKEYPRWQIIPLVFIATVYTYHWIPCVMSAIMKMLTCKPTWVKTPRFNNTKKEFHAEIICFPGIEENAEIEVDQER